VLGTHNVSLQLHWSDNGIDLDLHAARRRGDGTFCRDATRKARDVATAPLGGSIDDCGASEHLDCAYNTCIAGGTYAVDWGLGAFAPNSAGHPVLNGDGRGANGDRVERIDAPAMPLGRYHVAVAHPAPNGSEPNSTADVRYLVDGACRACVQKLVAALEWQPFGDIIVDATTVTVPASDGCSCP
jgi:hypothetical protein